MLHQRWWFYTGDSECILLRWHNEGTGTAKPMKRQDIIHKAGWASAMQQITSYWCWDRPGGSPLHFISVLSKILPVTSHGDAVGGWNVGLPPLLLHSAQLGQNSCQLYAPAALYPVRAHFYYRLGWPQVYWMGTEGLGNLKFSKDLTGNRTRNLPQCLNQLRHRSPTFCLNSHREITSCKTVLATLSVRHLVKNLPSFNETWIFMIVFSTCSLSRARSIQSTFALCTCSVQATRSFSPRLIFKKVLSTPLITTSVYATPRL